jgi:hypothetical protein
MSHMQPGDLLPSWNDTRARDDILAFVEAATALPSEERVAVFDNDGTLWCEKPMPIELVCIMQRLVEMAEEEPSLRERQLWQAAYTRDFGWLGDAMIPPPRAASFGTDGTPRWPAGSLPAATCP